VVCALRFFYGVDVLLIGPSDLSIELGVPLDHACDTYQRALDKIAAIAAKYGIAAGMYLIPPGMDPNFFVQKGFKDSSSLRCPGSPGQRLGSRTPWPGSSANDGRRGRSGERLDRPACAADQSFRRADAEAPSEPHIVDVPEPRTSRSFSAELPTYSSLRVSIPTC
jgi:hypothetical protein